MTHDRPTLTVAISTRGVRAYGLHAANWPRAVGLDYLVLMQEAEAEPGLKLHLEALTVGRSDVTIRRLASTGLSRSRNAALDFAQGEIVLIADDDVAHPDGAFDEIRRVFAQDPDLDLLAGRSFTPDGVPRKPAHNRPHRLRLWNSGRISSHELAFRRARITAAGIRFDEHFGVGAGTPNFLGEEYIFVADCLKAGLRGCYLPFPLSIHPPESSGFVWEGRAAAQARAGVLARVFGPWTPLMRVAFAAKNFRRFETIEDLGIFLLGR